MIRYGQYTSGKTHWDPDGWSLLLCKSRKDLKVVTSSSGGTRAWKSSLSSTFGDNLAQDGWPKFGSKG